MLPIADTIERNLVLRATCQVVWAKSFATPTALASWFPEKIEGDFVVGENYTMIWGEHRCECRLVEFKEGESFVYQWHPGAACQIADHPESELTSVRFTLADHPDGTRVEMVESGFSNIPEARRTFAFSENDGGWNSELPKLERAHAL